MQGIKSMPKLDITIPSPGDSILEVTIATWKKTNGDWVEKDEDLLEIESDKATLEVAAPVSGILSINSEEGSEVAVGATVGSIDSSAKRPKESKKQTAAKATKPASENGTGQGSGDLKETSASHKQDASPRATSTARKLAAEKGLDLSTIHGSGPSGRVMKADVISAEAPSKPQPPPPMGGTREIRREKMTKLRQRIAERLVHSQQSSATLTTFNEVDMSAVMRLRSELKESFLDRHGVRLGFMSFFVKASVVALQANPRVNAYISGKEIEYHDYCDIAVAVGTDKGLVVPVLRNAEIMNFAQIEQAIEGIASKARAGNLTPDEMAGGTFTVSNGGVYGSMMSTPILNPPQTGILGMHKIMKRPVEDPSNPGQIVLKPMMYLAFSYDHRLIDGTEAVGFLVRIKECIEHPERDLIDF